MVRGYGRRVKSLDDLVLVVGLGRLEFLRGRESKMPDLRLWSIPYFTRTLISHILRLCKYFF